MKANCQALYTGIIISITSLILIIILSRIYLQCENKILEILLNVSIGLFGSGSISLLLTIPAYGISKRQLLEKYYHEVVELTKKFSNIRFLHNDFSEESIVNYIYYLIKKKNHEKLNIIEKNIIKEGKKYKNVLIKEYIKNHPELEKDYSKKLITKVASECVDHCIEMLRDNIKEKSKQYVILSEETITNLRFMIDDMQFFLGKKSLTKIYDKTFEPFLKTIEMIAEESIQFQYYLSGVGNEAVALEGIFRIQKELFHVETEESEFAKSVIIYNSFFNKMLVNLEELRAYLDNRPPKEQHPIPEEGRTFFIKGERY